MATNVPSPTPSEDNRQNNRDDTMYSALDKIMGNSVQSYDDFLNGFTYLKKGMQEKQDGKKDKTNKIADKVNKIPSTHAGIKLPRACSDDRKTVLKESTPDVLSLSNDLEEEILCEGDTTSRMAKTKVIKTGSLVKFDNFVDPVAADDDDVDDVKEIDDLSAEGYTASFTAGDTTRSTVAAEKSNDVAKAPSSRLQDDGDVTNMLDSKLSLDEKSTDKLLMNFLADLQNELNEGKPDSEPQVEAANSEMDIQNFLHENKKSSQQVLDPEEVSFNDDDDENDAINLLHDDSEKNDVKGKITEQDLKKMAGSHVIAEQERKSRLDDIYSNTLRDSEGNVQIVQSEEGMTEQEGVNGDIDIDKILFPGQVEERTEHPGSENDRLLDFKATFRESSAKTDQRVESTDLIEPFKLDEDFDYDNVVLAPKFSSEDLQHIKLTVKPQTVVM